LAKDAFGSRSAQHKNAVASDQVASSREQGGRREKAARSDAPLVQPSSWESWKEKRCQIAKG